MGYSISIKNGGGTYNNVLNFFNSGLGIGTQNPAAFLDVGYFINNGALGTVFGRLAEGNSTGSGTFLGVRGFGTQQGDFGGKSFALEHSFYGVVNSSINFFRGGGTGGGFLTFNTQENIERMRLTGDGNLALGTTDPKGFKLAVAGKAVAEEIVVQLQGNWPDYVFEERYKLVSLPELEQFIRTNKHLPDVPSQQQVMENGVSLGQMNAILLKKIEELTLYVIELQKQNEEQQKQIDLLNCK